MADAKLVTSIIWKFLPVQIPGFPFDTSTEASRIKDIEGKSCVRIAQDARVGSGSAPWDGCRLSPLVRVPTPPIFFPLV